MPSIAPGALRLDISLDQRNLRRLRTLASVSKLAAAKALTATARESVPAWIAANHRVFHMRRTWIDRGVRYRMATPGDLNAQVGTVDKYMARHVVGLGEEKKSSAGRLFVPLIPVAQQGTHTQLRAKLRQADSTTRKTFKLVVNGKTFIARRRGRSRSDLQIMGELMDHVRIPQRLDVQTVVSGVVNARFGPIYERLLLKTLEAQNT